MSTAQTWRTKATSLEDTLAIASRIGAKLKGGEVIELVSDLGGGKTAFVRGLASGMGSDDAVRSPSFTLSNIYSAGELTLHHFDFYRLEEAGIMRDEIAEVLADSKAVLAIEWAGVIEDVIPVAHIVVNIMAIDDNQRDITVLYPKEMQYLIETYT